MTENNEWKDSFKKDIRTFLQLMLKNENLVFDENMSLDIKNGTYIFDIEIKALFSIYTNIDNEKKKEHCRSQILKYWHLYQLRSFVLRNRELIASEAKSIDKMSNRMIGMLDDLFWRIPELQDENAAGELSSDTYKNINSKLRSKNLNKFEENLDKKELNFCLEGNEIITECLKTKLTEYLLNDFKSLDIKYDNLLSQKDIEEINKDPSRFNARKIIQKFKKNNYHLEHTTPRILLKHWVEIACLYYTNDTDLLEKILKIAELNICTAVLKSEKSKEKNWLQIKKNENEKYDFSFVNDNSENSENSENTFYLYNSNKFKEDICTFIQRNTSNLKDINKEYFNIMGMLLSHFSKDPFCRYEGIEVMMRDENGIFKTISIPFNIKYVHNFDGKAN
jgi:hypothetical protein